MLPRDLSQSNSQYHTGREEPREDEPSAFPKFWGLLDILALANDDGGVCGYAILLAPPGR